VLIEHNTVFASKRSAISNTCFPGTTVVLDANGISIASAVFAGLTRWQTDRPRYKSVTICGTQWKNQILLLSMATTSIYWSSRSRLNKLTQLFTYLLTHKLFSSCIPRYLVSCLQLSDSSVICHVTYFQFLIQCAFLPCG